MSSIVVAFPKKEVAQKIRKILAQSGYDVPVMCTTGAQTLAGIAGLEEGIVVCGARFVDMMYTELYEYLPKGFQMLLVASADYISECGEENLVCLPMPVKVHELLQALEALEAAHIKQKKHRKAHRSEEDIAVITEAKALLMERRQLTEEEAHRYIQKLSMDNGIGFVEESASILLLYKKERKTNDSDQ